MAAVQTSLLMRSGDVETNPGPGRYGGKLYTIILVRYSAAICSKNSDLDYDDVDSNTVLSEFW